MWLLIFLSNTNISLPILQFDRKKALYKNVYLRIYRHLQIVAFVAVAELVVDFAAAVAELVIAVAVPRWDGIWLRTLDRDVISIQVLWDILVQPGTEHL